MPTKNDDKRKQSLYFPTPMIEQLEKEAARQERSMSWLVQKAWELAYPQIRAFQALAPVMGTTPTPK